MRTPPDISGRTPPVWFIILISLAAGFVGWLAVLGAATLL